MPKAAAVSDQLREAVLASKLSRYEISRRTGIAQSILSRFVNTNAGLSLANVDKLCEVLGVEVRVKSGKGK